MTARTGRAARTTAALAVVVLVAGALWFARADAAAEREHLLESWRGDMSAWSAERLDTIGPAGSHGPATAAGLTDAVTGWAVRPVLLTGEPAPGESVDPVNAACTALGAFADAVGDTPEPPAAPRGLDTAADDSGVVEAVRTSTGLQRALADYRRAIERPHAELRQLCGTYPTLVAAHAASTEPLAALASLLECGSAGCTVRDGTDTGAVAAQLSGAMAEPNQRIADALATQCPLPELVEVCTADAAHARALASAAASWRDALATGDVAAAATAAADLRTQTDAGEETFRLAAERVLPGADRPRIARLTADGVAARTGALTDAAAGFAAAVG